eukprot:2998408-Amphidinium_carterae.1
MGRLRMASYLWEQLFTSSASHLSSSCQPTWHALCSEANVTCYMDNDAATSAFSLQHASLVLLGLQSRCSSAGHGMPGSFIQQPDAPSTGSIKPLLGVGAFEVRPVCPPSFVGVVRQVWLRTLRLPKRKRHRKDMTAVRFEAFAVCCRSQRFHCVVFVSQIVRVFLNVQ